MLHFGEFHFSWVCNHMPLFMDTHGHIEGLAADEIIEVNEGL
jgi:hypothetical protein